MNSVSPWNSWRNVSNVSSRSSAPAYDDDSGRGCFEKEWAISKPIPLPPSVMRIVLTNWLSEGLVGEMEEYVSRWCVVVMLARDMIRTGAITMLGKP